MTKTALTKKALNGGPAYGFRGLVHHHHSREHGGTQVWSSMAARRCGPGEISESCVLHPVLKAEKERVWASKSEKMYPSIP